jgi:hypothetical protein
VTLDATDVSQMFMATNDALKMLRALTAVEPDKTQDALQLIATIVDSLQEGFDGKTTPEIVEAELKALTTRAAALIPNRQLHDKFDTGD